MNVKDFFFENTYGMNVVLYIISFRGLQPLEKYFKRRAWLCKWVHLKVPVSVPYTLPFGSCIILMCFITHENNSTRAQFKFALFFYRKLNISLARIVNLKLIEDVFFCLYPLYVTKLIIMSIHDKKMFELPNNTWPKHDRI